MKRTLSLVLALIMVLGSFTTVFAATEAEKTAAEFLAEEGVLLGANGDLMLENNLERRDAVVLLSRLLGVEDEAAEFATTEESPSFEDARNDAYYVPFIAWAEVNEYFEGDDEGNFNPRNDITAQEFALVLLRALEFEASGNAAWKAALEDAEELGLLKDVEVEEKEAVVRGEMAVMIFNTLNTKVNGSDETLAEKLGIEMPEAPKAKELTAEVNDTENLAEIVVELSNAELVDKDDVENTNNYKLSGDREVVFAKLVGDNVVLNVTNPDTSLNDRNPVNDSALVRNREYTLTIRGIDRAINGEYKFRTYDNAAPAIESVEALGEYGIKVTTSEPIVVPNERDFLVEGRRVSMIVEQYGRDIILTPYNNQSFDTKASELEIIEIEDFAGYRSTSIRETIEIEKDEVAPEVVEAIRLSDTRVVVEFDKDIREGSVSHEKSTRNKGNVSYRDGRQTLYATNAYKVDTNKVEYRFVDLPRGVELTIEGVENHSKVKMDRANIVPKLVSDNYDAVISNNDKRQTINVPAGTTQGVAYGESLELTVEFDRDIEASSINVSNFVLYKNEVSKLGELSLDSETSIVAAGPTGTRIGDEPNELIVVFDGLYVNNAQKEYDYVLEVTGLEVAGTGINNIVRIPRDYIEFEVLAEKTFLVDGTPTLVEARYTDYTEIRINLTRKADGTEATDERNFYIGEDSIYDLGGEAILERNGYRISLLIPMRDSKFEAEYPEGDLTISRRVVDVDGNILENRSHTLSY